MGPNHKSNGHKGWPVGPTPWPASSTLSRFRPKLDGYAPTSIYTSIPCLRVGGDREEWSVGHMDSYPAIHHLQTDLIKSAEAPLDLYIWILTVELSHTTLFM
jgi:hypothetical protein